MEIDKIKEIEKRIGYSFVDKDKLVQAFTTGSYAKEENDHNRLCKSQEEYRTYGDSILKEILIGLLKEHGFRTPQQITEAKKQLENKVKQFEIFSSFKIPFDYFQKTKGEPISVPLYAETFESLICAMYLDIAITDEDNAKKETKKYIERLFEPYINNLTLL